MLAIALLWWGLRSERAATPDYSLTGNAILIATEGNGVNVGRLIKVTQSTTEGWVEGPVAGTGLTLNWPGHISLDAAGHLYISDRDNGRIVRLDDVAGNLWKAFSGVGSNILVPPPVIFEVGGGNYASDVVADSAGRIYVTEVIGSSARVVRIDNMNGDGWTVFNSSNTCAFTGPAGVLVDGQGRIYIVDGAVGSTHRIIRINDISGAGCITYGSQGNGVGRFNNPAALTMDSQGRIYIPDEDNHRIVRINDMTGAGWVSFGSYGHGVGQFYEPHDISTDNLGRIYIADTGNSRIIRINSMTGAGWVEFVRKGCYGNCYAGSDISGPFLIDATKGIRVLGSGPVLTYQGVFPQVAVGGGYRTSITGVNIGKAAADAQVSLAKTVPPPCGDITKPVCAAPFAVTVGDVTDSSFTRNVPPMGTIRLDAGSSGDVSVGYATFKSTEAELAGAALFQSLNGDTITSEAGVSFSPATEHFVVYIDNTNNARTGYAIANPVWVYDTSPSAPGLLHCSTFWNLILRDKSGRILETRSGGNGGAPQMSCGMHIAEFADQRFPSSVGPGFEGSIEFAAGNLTSVGAQKWQQTNARAVVLRYDNASQDVFTTIPVIVPVPDANEDSQSDPVKTTFPVIEPRTLYYPQIADGGSYRTNFVLANPTSAAANVTVAFFSDDGTPLALPINGNSQTSLTVPLAAYSVMHFLTDGTSQGIKTGWARVSQPAVAPWFSIGGSAIFQTVSDGRITSEAGVSFSALTSHLLTPVSSLGFTQSGIAICNPNSSPVNLTFQLRDSSGQVVASATKTLPPLGHTAQFFTTLFGGFDQFEGTVEVTSNGGSVSGVALRYDNPGGTVFATTPVIVLP